MLWEFCTQYASKFGKLNQSQDWKRSVFISIPKKGSAKECSNYHTITLISHTSKVMLKILQARLQQYVNHELLDVQAGFRRGRGTRGQIQTSIGSSKKQENSIKISTSVSLTMLKAFDCADHNKLWKILKEMVIPDHLICHWRNRYAGQDTKQQTGLNLGKEYIKAVYCYLLV